MSDFLWNIFEIAVNFLEAFIIFYFVCGFLKHDFKTPKGKLVFVVGGVLKAVMTTLVNLITLYDWWIGCLNILGWFAISCVLLRGEVTLKLYAAAITGVVSLVSGNFVTAVLSVTLNSAPEELFVMQSVYRIIGVLGKLSSQLQQKISSGDKRFRQKRGREFIRATFSSISD